MLEIKPLSLRVPLQPDEPPPYFAARLAARNFRTARSFAQDMGLVFQDLVDGNGPAVAKLAALGDVSASVLMNSALTKSKNVIMLKGDMLHPNLLRRDRLRVCPICLQDDIARSDLPAPLAVYGRASWMLASLRTCPVHSIALVDVSAHAPAAVRHDWTRSVTPLLGRLDMLSKTARARAPSGLEIYLMNRWGNQKETSGWLDNWPFYAAILASEVVGAVAAFGKWVNLATLSETEKFEAGGAGFEILKAGPESLIEFLAKIRGNLSVRSGPQAAYGRLYTNFAYGLSAPGFDPIREVMSEYILSEFPLGPGDKIFGRPVTHRKVHSIYTASETYKISSRRLRAIISTKGLISDPSTPNSQVLFDANIAQKLFAQDQNSLSMKQIEKHLNAHRTEIERLIDAGLIRRHDIGQAHEVFFIDELDAFLARLCRDAEPVAQPGPGILSISQATKQARRKGHEIVQLILDRKLNWVGRRADATGYASILVDIEEVKSRAVARPSTGLPFYKAVSALNTSDRVLRKLIETRAIKTAIALNPANGRRQKLVPFRELERFRSTYVSLHVLSKEIRQHHSKTLEKLQSRNVHPVDELGDVGASFYRRSDVKKILLS